MMTKVADQTSAFYSLTRYGHSIIVIAGTIHKDCLHHLYFAACNGFVPVAKYSTESSFASILSSIKN